MFRDLPKAGKRAPLPFLRQKLFDVVIKNTISFDIKTIPLFYIFLARTLMFVGQKKFESYFSDRLTFSNICGVTSHRIYRLALPLLSPEMLIFSLSKFEISI